jgi:hypothetical protein
VLAHVQLIDEADRPRLAALGVIANAEPLWAQLDDVMEALTVPRLGEPRAALPVGDAARPRQLRLVAGQLARPARRDPLPAAGWTPTSGR